MRNWGRMRPARKCRWEVCKLSIPKEWLAFLREQYPAGSRIKLREMKDPYHPVPPGTTGTLESIDDIGQFHVKWDNGSGLALVMGEDSFTVLPPEPTIMKLYMPLTADFYERNEWGDIEDYSTELEGGSLRNYEGQILKALIGNRMPEEAESGIMHWYADKQELEESIIRRHYGTIVMDSEQPQGGGTSAGGMAQGIQAAPDFRKTVFRP